MKDVEKIIEEMRKTYLKFLHRVPDKSGIQYFVSQIKEGKISLDELPQMLKNSQEYRYSQLVKLRNADLPTLQRMEKDWSDRAETDAKFFIRVKFNQDDADFWESGKKDCNDILGVGTSRFEKIFPGKDQKKMKVLEIGCGIGRILFPMAEIFGEAVGVDISIKMVDIGQEYVKKYPNCKILLNNGADLSMFQDNSFDFCFSYIVFQHIPEKSIVKNYIREVSRILKGNSLFRFQVFGDSDAPVDGTTWYGVHFTSKEMHEIAKLNKFEIIEETGEKDQYYWLTFKSQK